MADAEGVIGELKNRHGLDRVRSRGTPLFHLQLLLGCAALNCKRIADHLPKAANGVASAPTAAARDLQPATAGSAANHPGRRATADAANRTFAAPQTNWNYTVCLN